METIYTIYRDSVCNHCWMEDRLLLNPSRDFSATTSAGRAFQSTTVLGMKAYLYASMAGCTCRNCSE